jgi:hypothetical protein
MSVKKCVLPNFVDKKLQVCKISKLHIFVITNIFRQIFVTFGRIGTRCPFLGTSVSAEKFFRQTDRGHRLIAGF